MEHFGGGVVGRQRKDRRVLLVSARIALRGHDDGEGRRIAPRGRHLVEPADRGGVQDRQEVAFEPHHQYLAFRIAETHVVLDELGTLGGDHQAGEEDALEGMAVRRHAADRRHDDLLHRALYHAGRHDGRRRIGAHAAGVRAGIAVADALVILCGGERQRVHAVAQAEEARLLAVEEGFHDHFRAGRAEGAVEAVVDGGERLVERHGDGHALAGGKPVRLDDDRGALGLDIGPGGGGVGEASIGAGRDVVLGAQVLGEALGALEPGGGRGAEDGDAVGAQHVGKAGDQRRLGADDDEGHAVLLAEGRDGGVVLDVEGNQRRAFGDARIAGCGVERVEKGGLREFPGKGVLASARSDQQNLHARTLDLMLVAGGLRGRGRKVKGR